MSEESQITGIPNRNFVLRQARQNQPPSTAELPWVLQQNPQVNMAVQQELQRRILMNQLQGQQAMQQGLLQQNIAPWAQNMRGA